MNNIETLTTLLGWSVVFHIGLLMLSAVFIILLRDWTSRLHSRLFGVTQEQLPRLYLKFLGDYKIAILVFSLVPYLALKML